MNFKRGVYFQMSFTYAEAQMRIDDPSQDDEITQSLRHLNQLAKILKRKRIEQGQEKFEFGSIFSNNEGFCVHSSLLLVYCYFRALTLASPEVRFHIDSETHDPVDLQTKELK